MAGAGLGGVRWGVGQRDTTVRVPGGGTTDDELEALDISLDELAADSLDELGASLDALGRCSTRLECSGRRRCGRGGRRRWARSWSAVVRRVVRTRAGCRAQSEDAQGRDAGHDFAKHEDLSGRSRRAPTVEDMTVVRVTGRLGRGLTTGGSPPSLAPDRGSRRSGWRGGNDVRQRAGPAGRQGRRAGHRPPGRQRSWGRLLRGAPAGCDPDPTSRSLPPPRRSFGRRARRSGPAAAFGVEEPAGRRVGVGDGEVGWLLGGADGHGVGAARVETAARAVD